MKANYKRRQINSAPNPKYCLRSVTDLQLTDFVNKFSCEKELYL